VFLRHRTLQHLQKVRKHMCGTLLKFRGCASAEQERLPRPESEPRQQSLPAGGLDDVTAQVAGLRMSHHVPDPFAGARLALVCGEKKRYFLLMLLHVASAPGDLRSGVMLRRSGCLYLVLYD